MRRRPRAAIVAPLRLAVCVLLALGTAACSADSDWREFRGENGSGATSNALYPPLGLRWKLRLQFKGDEAESFNPPIVQDDTIFFGSSDGNFYALDSESGYMRWIFQTGNQINSAAFADDDAVYFGSNDGSVYAVDIDSGEEKWRFPTGNTVQSLVLRYKDHVIFTSDTGATFFLSPEGKLQHRIPNRIWSHHTFQVYDGVVYWAPLGNGFGAYDIEQRKFLWEFDVRKDAPRRAAIWYSFPAIDENRVYFASNFLTGGLSGMQSRLSYYAVDRRTGETIWRKRDEYRWSRRLPRDQDVAFFNHVPLLDYMAPSLYDNLVIFTSGDTTVRAFDRDSGEEVWEESFDYPTSSAPTVAGDRVYFGVEGEVSAGGLVEKLPRLICLDARDGQRLWEMELEGAILSAPVVAGKRMFFGTDKNMFYVLEEVF